MDDRAKLVSTLLGDVLSPLAIMDVGAMPEGKERYSPLVEAGLASVVGFEPNLEHAAKLSQRPGFTFLPYFLGDGEPGTYYATAYPGCGSLYEPDPAVIDLFQGIGAREGRVQNFRVIDTFPVETRRLDDVAEAGFPDLIKLDVQGSELNVLRNGASRLSRCLVVECEAEFIAMYRGQPLFGDIQCFMASQGFVLHKFIDVAGMPLRPFQYVEVAYRPLSQLLWADAVFVRDFTRMDLLDDGQLAKTALILDVVHHSFDLAALFVRELDRRRGGGVYDAYMATLEKVKVDELQVLNWRRFDEPASDA